MTAAEQSAVGSPAAEQSAVGSPADAPALAVVGGTGLYSFFADSPDAVTEHRIETPYGEPSAPVTIGTVGGRRVAFLPRHGRRHEFSPHTVPYLANLRALRSLGVRRVLAPCAVGSLRPDLGPGALVLPDQVVDRTQGRAGTFFDGGGVHVSFADPYCPTLRGAAAPHAEHAAGTMVVIEGPRFSSRAESRWYAAQGWDLVNMTGQPEAALARELRLCYQPVALVTDLDAGIEPGAGVRTEDVLGEFRANLPRLVRALTGTIAALDPDTACTCAAGEQRVP